MNEERSQLVEWLRGEIVGPTQLLNDSVKPFVVSNFTDNRSFRDERKHPYGPAAWHPGDGSVQEVLYYDQESPHRKYGTGVLYPFTNEQNSLDQVALNQSDNLGVELNENEIVDGGETIAENDNDSFAGGIDSGDDFEVSSPDVRKPSTMGISFCVRFDTDDDAGLIVTLPRERKFSWQLEQSRSLQLNGRYEKCTRIREGWELAAWRRHEVFPVDATVVFARNEFVPNKVIRRDIPSLDGCPVGLRLELYPRKLQDNDEVWLFTLVLRNVSQGRQNEVALFQAFFEVEPKGGMLAPYPENGRPFEELDPDEQSLQLLYRESRIWGIGHGCAAAWDADPDEKPVRIMADVLPAVQLPSMTPDITDHNGKRIQLSMRELCEISDDGNGPGWEALQGLANEYQAWIEARIVEINSLPVHLRKVAKAHMDACEVSLGRIRRGIDLLQEDGDIRCAFKLANLSMLLQQISAKVLDHRPLEWNRNREKALPSGKYGSPWQIFSDNKEGEDVGLWRAFQLAFLLMSIEGVVNGESEDREIVDLIWFPTGGGKTEAYLGVMAFSMFQQRLACRDEISAREASGTHVLMRYTLRMLTTQQFQRGASLVCAMEFLRRNPNTHNLGNIPGERFSLGLWIGSSASPNKVDDARTRVARFKRGKEKGNPLVLSECPWCRAAIGRYGENNHPPAGVRQVQWNGNFGRDTRTTGIKEEDGCPLLVCSDTNCEFSGEYSDKWLPVEVIDARIYAHPPSLVISTADKLAMVAYRPEAGALFGMDNGTRVHRPPRLIVQDELHLISGPLGTMYALYEGIFEPLCSEDIEDGRVIRPKVIASTATIRGADQQVTALYDRPQTCLFPSPGLTMGDSFFGTYARDSDTGKLSEGRLYLGIHAANYSSLMTAQVRAFSSVLFRAGMLSPETGCRDPWWTLLVFYNSLRELGGARTLFDSDIGSRLKFLFNREGRNRNERRYLNQIEELTSRLSQAEIVSMMDRLTMPWIPEDSGTIDACLASNIIEVGVDIDRLSLMGVVGQPKTTSQYIQVTGRVGRRWWERPGLILSIYNPFKSRDRSHFEQFHGYHRRLYEQVEPTTATPFSVAAIQRGLPGVLIAWARQHSNTGVHNFDEYRAFVESGLELLKARCRSVEREHADRSVDELDHIAEQLIGKWGKNPQVWENFPPNLIDEYLMLWPGQYYTSVQEQIGVQVPSSMRQVDASSKLTITQAYVGDNWND